MVEIEEVDGAPPASRPRGPPKASEGGDDDDEDLDLGEIENVENIVYTGATAPEEDDGASPTEDAAQAQTAGDTAQPGGSPSRSAGTPPLDDAASPVSRGLVQPSTLL